MPGTDGEEKATSACLCKWYWGKGGTWPEKRSRSRARASSVLLRAKKARPKTSAYLSLEPLQFESRYSIECDPKVRPSSEERLSEGGVWQSDYFRRSARPSWLVWPDFGAGSLGAGDELGYS